MVVPTTIQSKKEKKMEVRQNNFKNEVLASIAEMITDNDSVYESVIEQSSQHINQNDRILTHGQSFLLAEFLKCAKTGRVGEDDKTQAGINFEVLVCETAPLFSGHRMAKVLQDSGLKVYVLPDSNVYSLMSRIDKVIISCQAILANGGLIAPAGAYQICLAAKVS